MVNFWLRQLYLSALLAYFVGKTEPKIRSLVIIREPLLVERLDLV